MHRQPALGAAPGPSPSQRCRESVEVSSRAKTVPFRAATGAGAGNLVVAEQVALDVGDAGDLREDWCLPSRAGQIGRRCRP
jgi:hypothetical protein